MGIFKSEPKEKIINGTPVMVSETCVVTNNFYYTTGESVIVVKDVDYCEINLNSKTTEHITIKALTHVLVKADNLIDDEFDEIELDKGACVEFRYIGGLWYILSSDGLKNS